MCLICIEFQKQKMTTKEARRALGEMRVAMDDEHVREVQDMLREADEAQREAQNQSDQEKD